MKEITEVFVVHTAKVTKNEYRYHWDSLRAITQYQTSKRAIERNPSFYQDFNVGACIVTKLIDE
ncbi:MAG: hypothetical protein KBT27_05165 [Prevotellaceae bacterium]|nr:hypothetical protein [Candidatus Faecinaster equi]